MACKNVLSSSNSIEKQSSDETDEEDRHKKAVTEVAKTDAHKMAQASTPPNPNSRGTEMKTRYYKVTTFKHLNLSEIRKREIIHRMRREESIEEDEKENESSGSDDNAMQVENSPPKCSFSSSADTKASKSKQNSQNCAVLPPAQF